MIKMTTTLTPVRFYDSQDRKGGGGKGGLLVCIPIAPYGYLISNPHLPSLGLKVPS